MKQDGGVQKIKINKHLYHHLFKTRSGRGKEGKRRSVYDCPRVWTRLKAKFYNILVINVYAPTNENEKENKEYFYEEIQSVYNKIEKIIHSRY